ncbi:Pycsar system effector family protein [Marinigracilibium pacificum]|uniref:HD domain-containing protein n=1 Tax=Marinigracilibium pacificum TaxID=2729599 RepID=A0A848IUQ5_9BACT|nr:Pycsar system effector family protein [Marinigracilibium pacificum]NMM48233.1 HD domain-containing protein [Marinigracilibium pacificum]
MSVNVDILSRAEDHVRELISANQNNNLIYHNLDHTISVVNACEQLADFYKLNITDYNILICAAWFHDVGYFLGNHEAHEENSVKEAKLFLEQEGVNEDFIKKVEGCIMATKMPQSPTGLLQEILCDADLFHLGTDDFYSKSNRLKEEFEVICDKDIPDVDWNRNTIAFLKSHEFHTDYGKKFLTPLKRENLDRLQKTFGTVENDLEDKFDNISSSFSKEEESIEKPKKKKKSNKPEKGIETMFRITARNHIELSAIADNKANIMISVNSIIVSILVTVLFRKLEEFPSLVIPSIMLLSTCLVTMVFAILATRPNVTSGVFTEEDIRMKRSNLLFFGNFYKMNLEDYEKGLNELMKDRDFLYGSLTRDIFFLGKVLGRKYKLLRYAYTVFMFGFIFSAIAFGVAMLFHGE